MFDTTQTLTTTSSSARGDDFEVIRVPPGQPPIQETPYPDPTGYMPPLFMVSCLMPLHTRQWTMYIQALPLLAFSQHEEGKDMAIVKVSHRCPSFVARNMTCLSKKDHGSEGPKYTRAAARVCLIPWVAAFESAGKCACASYVNEACNLTANSQVYSKQVIICVHFVW